jgi:hypothetical protein
MIQTLIVLDSKNYGSRDLWWVDDPDARVGYNIYRAFDYPTDWQKLNQSPWLGHFYRDQVTFEEITYTLTSSDWLAQGEAGKFGFRLPSMPYSSVVEGRPTISNNPDDVDIYIDGTKYRPALVNGFDQSVWLRMDREVPMGGLVSSFPLTPEIISTSQITVVYNSLKNYVDISTNLVRTFYTVVPVGVSGELHEPGARGSQVVNSQDIDKMTWEFSAMITRNQWILEQAAEPAHLMFRKTRGRVCGCKTDLKEPLTACKSCFGVGIVGGYYGPYDFLFAPPDTALQVELEEGGKTVTRISNSFLGPTPIIQSGDLVIRKNGDRLVVARPTYVAPRGVIVQQHYDTELLKPGDTRYLIPFSNAFPTLFNPIVRGDPMDGGKGNGEPLVDPRMLMKDKTTWENEAETPIGRTITFGRIQGV